MKFAVPSLVFAVLLLFACKNDQFKGDIGKTGIPVIDSLTRAIAKQAKNPVLYAQRGMAFMDNNNCESAIRDMASALTLDSQNVEVHHMLADVYMECGQSILGLRTMTRAATLAPERLGTQLKFSEFQYILEQYDGSLKTLDGLLLREQNNPEVYFMIGKVLAAKGDTVRAINGFKKCVSLDATHIDGYVELGNLFEKRNNPIALQYFDNALRVDSTHIAAIYSKAMYYQNRYQDDEALAQYRRIIGFDTHFNDAYLNSGIIYLDQKKLKEALDQFTICIKQDPLATTAHFMRGYTLERMSQDSIPAAIASYKTALGQSPSYTEAKDALKRLGVK
jgi:tetratricopeptide (TPR) repeat protein